MALTPGTRFGSYEVTAQIGVGGMGEVYRARDTKLGREVALKVLPDLFVSDPDRVARFQREAKTLAALNHPNIGGIYGLEEANGVTALVLELVEGPTLADRIAEGPMPLDEALPIAKQIADALEAAHEHGIIHRDLKPANIKVRPDGTVKVLDFGLAKPRDSAPASIAASDSPTMTSPAMTRMGVILGTAAYTSPEQARGKPVDKRGDIWAFGVVLYEMVTGRRLFEGDTVSDTLASLLTKEPEWERVPRRIRPLLRRCIEKDPKRRLHDIADAWLLLDEANEIAPSRSNKTLYALAAVLAVAALGSGVLLWRAASETDPPPPPLIHLDLDLGPDASLGSGIGPTALLSPDGLRLAIVSQGSDGIRRLFTRRLDQPRATALIGSEGAYAPFFSPDARWLGFFAEGKLKKISVEGGEPVSLLDAPAGRGASWGEDDSIVAALDSQVGLSRVPAGGGSATLVTEVQSGENSHRWPQILPGGKAVLFSLNTAFGNFDEASIAVTSLEDHRTKTVIEHAGMYPQYLRSGHLIYVKKTTLFAVPFDLDRLEVRGNPSPILEEIASDPNFGFAQIVTSRTGTALYRRGRAEGLRLVQWLNEAGLIEPLLPQPAPYQFVRLSRDGTRIATVVPDGPNSVLWIYDWQRGARTRLTTGEGVNTYPVWSPDGQYLVYQAAGGIFASRADGAGKPQQLTQSKLLQCPGSFSPDGKRLVFSQASAGLGASLQTVALASKDGYLQASEPELFLGLRSVNAYPAFSPDGRWLAYASADSGIYEVYVRAYPDRGSQWHVSNNGGTMPVWSPNGHELFYRTEDQRIMVTSYAVKGDSFVAAKPRVWSAKPLANLGLTPNFDLAPDGKRFAVVMPAERPEPRDTQSHVTLVLNFFEEVRRRTTDASR